MNNTTKGIIAVLAIGALVYGAYVLTYDKKHRYATLIIQLGKYQGGVVALHTFGEDYLKAWAKAAKKNQSTFTLNGVTYNTQGGKETK